MTWGFVYGQKGVPSIILVYVGRKTAADLCRQNKEPAQAPVQRQAAQYTEVVS
jgi:hypothetical protein